MPTRRFTAPANPAKDAARRAGAPAVSMSDSAPATLADARSVRLATCLIALIGTALLAWRFRHYTMDDAYIGYRYVANLLAGRGFVFNPGERVEGVTNAGWLLVLTPFAAVLGPPLAGKLLGALSLAAVAGLTSAVTWRLGPSHPVLAVLAAALVLAQFDLAYFSLTGMETGFTALLLLLVVWLGFRERPVYAMSIVSGVVYLVRPEAALVYPLALALMSATGRLEVKRLLWHGVGFAAPIAAATVARYAYFGALLPNTFDAKSGATGEGLVAILLPSLAAPVNLPFPFTGLFVLLPLAAGLWCGFRHAPRATALAAGVLATGFLFARYAAPDWTGTGRYFAPFLPVGIAVLLAGGQWIERRLTGGPRPWATIALACLMLLAGGFDTLFRSHPQRLERFPGYVLTALPLRAPAEWIRDNLPADALVASRRIGALAYFGERPVFDYANGLTDREVARRIRAKGERFWSPADPRLADLWQARRPDFLLEDSDVIDKLVAEVGGSADLFRIHGMAYRVIRRFPIGLRRTDGLFGKELRPIDWTLAQRIEP